MNRYEFEEVRHTKDVERATHVVFDEAYEKWCDAGRESLTVGQLNVLAVETFFGEILNGGFYQYFSNESGELANAASTALREVGLHEHAVVLESFLVLFPDGRVPEDADERQEQLGAIDDQHDESFFEQLEEPFWDLYHKKKTEFRQNLFNYIVRNETEFVSD